MTGLGRDREGGSLLGVKFLHLVLQASALRSLQALRASIPSNFAEAKGLNVIFLRCPSLAGKGMIWFESLKFICIQDYLLSFCHSLERKSGEQ